MAINFEYTRSTQSHDDSNESSSRSKIYQYPAELGSNEYKHAVVFFINSVKNSKYANIDIAPPESSEEDTSTTDNIGSFIGEPSTEFNHRFGAEVDRLISETGSEDQSSNRQKIPGELKESGTKRSLATIALYMPESVQSQYNISYSTVENKLAAFGGIGDTQSVSDTLKDLGTTGAATAAGKVLGGMGTGMDPSVIKKLGLKLKNYAVNPHNEQVFDGVPFREFSYKFDFYPANEKEVNTVNDIITLFKFHALPEMKSATQGRFFIYPSEFDIVYWFTTGGRNPWVNKISTCALTSINVNYTPDGIWAAFKNGSPVHVVLELKFNELEIMTKERIRNGY